MNGVGKRGPTLSKFEIYHSFDHHNYHTRFHQLASEDESWRLGGYTIVYDKTLGLAGVSVCSPKDQFSRKHGRELAMDRMRTALTMREHGRLGVLIVVPTIHGGKVAPQLRRSALMEAVAFMDEHVYVWGTMNIVEVFNG